MFENTTNFLHYILAFGSNLGDRETQLRQGVELLKIHLRSCRFSSWVSTAPLVSSEYDTHDHEHYINFVCHVVAQLSPAELYARICAIEDQVGHERARKWLPRRLDIDILFCAQGPMNATFAQCDPVHWNDSSGLLVPHRAFWERDFLVQLVTNDLGIAQSVLLQHLSKSKESEDVTKETADFSGNP